MSKTLQGHRTELNKTRKNKQKGQKHQQSVVAGRQQLYCAVQSRSPSHRQTTTKKVRSSAHDGTSSAKVHSWQTTAGCSTHVPKPLGRHDRWALNLVRECRLLTGSVDVQVAGQRYLAYNCQLVGHGTDNYTCIVPHFGGRSFAVAGPKQTRLPAQLRRPAIKLR